MVTKSELCGGFMSTVEIGAKNVNLEFKIGFPCHQSYWNNTNKITLQQIEIFKWNNNNYYLIIN